MIQRYRQRNHASARYSAIRWFQPDTSAKRGRFADRASGVGANGCASQPRGYGCGRSAGRPSCNALPVPRIVNFTEMADQGTPTISELMQIVLPEDYGSGPP